jgi:hypothetical protein
MLRASIIIQLFDILYILATGAGVYVYIAAAECLPGAKDALVICQLCGGCHTNRAGPIESWALRRVEHL